MADLVPPSLMPQAPQTSELQNLGGPADVQATVDDLNNELAVHPATPFPEQRYNQYKQMIQQNQPGQPASEIERMSLEAAQRDVNTKAAQASKAQSAQAAQAAQIDKQNEMRSKLGMTPLPGGTPTPNEPMAPNADDFAKPVQAGPATAAKVPSASPEMAGLLGSYGTAQRANTAIANAQAQKGALDEMAQAELEDKLKAQEIKQQKIQADFNTAFTERTNHLEDISKQLAGQDFTAAKLDKDHFWSSKSTGQKVLAGIALGLGAVGGAMSGKDSKAMEVINKAIDRDIEEQKFNINQDVESKKMKTQNLRDQAGIQNNMLSNLRAKFGDDLQAESALRVLMIQQTQSRLQQYASGTESKTVIENAKILNAQLEQQKQQASLAMKAQLANQTLLQNMGKDGQGYNDLSPAQKAMLPKELREQFEKQGEVTAPGWVGQAPNKEVFNKFIEKQNELQPAIDGAQRILALTKDLNRVTDLAKKAEISTELKALAGQLRVPFTGPGALTQKEYERLMDTLGDPTSITSMPSLQRVRLQTVLKKLNGDLESQANAIGLRRRPTVNVPMRSYNK